jgi:asparagine synthase (glutamine-hydrolysing)
MWAFTLWDARKRKLVASRDRFGVKPLYYASVDGAWLFASEIKALFAYPGAFRGFNEPQMMAFLSQYRVDRDQDTVFSGVHAVAPGGYMEWADGHISHRKYWTLKVDSERAKASESELIGQFEHLLNDSVRLRVRSDVPIGTMLSGGLDSTAITALIHKQRRLGAAAGPVESNGLQAFHHTFSSCWPGWSDDEESDIDHLCTTLGLSSNKIYPTSHTVGDLLPKVMEAIEEPFPNPTPVIQYLLMQQARGHGVKVVLNGHGSDEALAGYPFMYVPVYLAELLLGGRAKRFWNEYRAFSSDRHWSKRDIAVSLLKGLTPVSLWPRFDALVQTALHSDMNADILSDAIPQPPDVNPAGLASIRGTSLVNATLWRTFAQTIVPMWLRIEDRTSMMWSVESRLPFMDYRLIEFAFSLPAHLKMKGGYSKHILRQAMSGTLPEQIVTNRVKRRFSSPFVKWIRNEWRPMIEDLLLGSCKVQPYLKTPLFRLRLRQFLDGNDQAIPGGVVWGILSAELCMRAVSATRPAEMALEVRESKGASGPDCRRSEP